MSLGALCFLPTVSAVQGLHSYILMDVFRRLCFVKARARREVFLE